MKYSNTDYKKERDYPEHGIRDVRDIDVVFEVITDQQRINQLKELVKAKREIEAKCDKMVTESWGRCKNDVTDTDFYALMKQRDEKTALIEKIILEL